MLPRHDDPILAVATAPGRGSVGIVRLSAKDIGPFVAAFFGRDLPPREACYLPFRDAGGGLIDHGLALFFAAPHSFTGEDVLELHGHGGPLVLQLLIARCMEVAAQQRPAVVGRTGGPADGTGSGTATCVLPDLRLAQPGEFSQRAFLNGKLDLAQAEAIADLIDASTEAAARSASQSLGGAFSQEIHRLRDALITLRMLVEATLDFPEEEIDFLQSADAQGQLDRLRAAVKTVQSKATQGALLREGIHVVLAGQPNAGKSSLLNALAGAELAIVTPVAGTTRDKVQQTIQIEGVPIHVIDTAGLRQSEDMVERIGIQRAWEAIGKADVVLFLHDLGRADLPLYQADDAEIAAQLAGVLPASTPVIDVWTKCDLVAQHTGGGVAVSTHTGEGLAALRQSLLAAAGWQAPAGGVFIARARHLQAIGRVQTHLTLSADHLAANAQSLDLVAEELRLAQVALGEITGEFSSDDLLGVIFSQFCIGK
jgi:tRNA modification GTPase